MAYDAFLSYAQTPDRALARLLRGALHRLARPPFALRALRVFLDQASLEATGALPTRLMEVLDESRFLILLASPESAASGYVNLEIMRWLELGRLDRLLIVRTGGRIFWDPARGGFDPDRTDALPRALHEAMGEEPLHLDIAWARETPDEVDSDPRFKEVVARLSARIKGLSLDEIHGADVLEQRRLGRLKNGAVALLCLLTLAAIGGAMLADQQRKLAEANERRSVLRAEVAQALAMVGTSPLPALERAAMAVRKGLEEVEPLPELRASLATILHAARERRRLSGPFAFDLPYGRIVDLAVSPDDEIVAAATSDLVYLLDRRGLMVAPPLAGPGGSALLANGLAWSPDGNELVVVSGETIEEELRSAAVRVYDTRGALVEELEGDRSAAFVAVTFAPDGDRILAGDTDGRLHEWSRAEGTVRVHGSHTGDPINAIAATRSGYVYSGSNLRAKTLKGLTVNTKAQVGAANQGQIGAVGLSLPRALEGGALCIALSPDMRHLVGCSEGGLATVWDLDYEGGLERRAVLKGHVGPVLAADLSPDGRVIATAGDDGTVRIWSRDGIALTPPLRGHDGAVAGLEFLDGGRTLLTAGADGTLREWDLADVAANRIELTRSNAHTGTLRVECGLVALPTYRSLKLLDLEGRAAGADLLGHGDADIAAVAIAPGCERVASASPHMDTQPSKVLLSRRAGEGGAIALAGLGGRASALAFSVDGTLAVGSGAFVPGRVDLRRAMGNVLGPDAELPEIDLGLRFYDREGRLAHTVPNAHDEEILVLAANPGSGGPAFASGAADGTVRLWSQDGRSAGPALAVVDNGNAGSGRVTALAFDPSGRYLAIANATGPVQFIPGVSGEFTIRVLEVAHGTLGPEWIAGEREIGALAFDSSGEAIASGERGMAGAQFGVRSWTRAGMPLTPVRHGDSPILAVAFAENGAAVHALDARGALRSWPSDASALLGIAKRRLAAFEADRAVKALLATAAGADPTLEQITRAIGERPEDASLYVSRAKLAAAGGDLQRALADCDEAVKRQPYYPVYRYTRGKMRFGAKDYAGAEDDFLAGIQFAYLFPRPPLVIADFVEFNRQSAAAMQMLHDRMPFELYEWLGITRYWLGKLPEAEQALTVAINGERRTHKTLGWRANVRMKLGRVDDALADLGILTDQEPGKRWAYIQRVKLKQAAGYPRATIERECQKLRELGAAGEEIPRACGDSLVGTQ